MRIGTLQIAPKLGEVAANIARADELVSDLEPGSLDLLVLPELALSGYNFSSLKAIKPYLEPTASGPSSKWAASTASRLNCIVVVGYPETTRDPSTIPAWIPEADSILPAQQTSNDHISFPEYKNYNSTITVSPTGQVLAHYRKTQLYYTDVPWALPSPTGWLTTFLPLSTPLPSLSTVSKSISDSPTLPALPSLSAPPITTPTHPASQTHPTTSTSFGICMDLSPRAFTAPWQAFELARHVHASRSPLLLASMAWLTRLTREELGAAVEVPDWSTVSYWVERLRPLLDGRAEGGGGEETRDGGNGHGGKGNQQTVVVIANRAGIEAGPTKAVDLELAQTGALWEGWRADEQGGVKLPSSASALGAGVARDGDSAGEKNGAGMSAGGNTTTHSAQTSADGDGSKDVSYGAEAESTLPGAEPIVPDKDGMADDEARYAGSSTVMALGGGSVAIWAVLGRAQEGVLVVDTSKLPKARWTLAGRGGDSESEDEVGDGDGDSNELG